MIYPEHGAMLENDHGFSLDVDVHMDATDEIRETCRVVAGYGDLNVFGTFTPDELREFARQIILKLDMVEKFKNEVILGRKPE